MFCNEKNEWKPCNWRWGVAVGMALLIANFFGAAAASAAELNGRIDKILFVGNSITLSPPGAGPGWEHNWGMAATAQGNDYAHLLAGKIGRATGHTPEVKVVNVAAPFEIGYPGEAYDVTKVLAPVAGYEPDVVVVELGANVRSTMATEEDRALFQRRFAELLEHLKADHRPDIYVTGAIIGETIPVKDQIMKEAAGSLGCSFVDMSGFSQDPANLGTAEGVFADPGVAGHPGDKGMAFIADRLCEAILAPRVRVGCYYFPHWTNAEKWTAVKEYGKSQPLLGFYRDEPEVFDRQIRWALANGVEFFTFCWYYDHMTNSTMEMNSLDEGFLRAEAAPMMGFSLFWCNEMENAKQITQEQMLAMAKIWKERYFNKPNYLRIDGKPVVHVSKPTYQLQAMGVEQTAGVFQAMAEAAGEADGIYFIAAEGGAESWCSELKPEDLKAAGFSAISAYAYATEGKHEDDYADMIDTYEKIWSALHSQDALPYIPPVTPCYDSTSIQDLRGFFHVRNGSSPELFREMCRRALPYLDTELKIVMLEAWNEYYEGTHIEPTQELGFGYLHAARDIFRPDLPISPDVMPTPEELAKWSYAYIPGANEAPKDGNLVVEPGFERQFGWTTYTDHIAKGNSAHPHSGKYAMRVGPEEVGVKSNYLIAGERGKSYKVSLWAKGRVRVSCALFDRKKGWLMDEVVLGVTPGGDEWRRFETEMKTEDGRMAFFNIQFDLQNVGGEGGWVDDIEIRAVEAPQ